MAWIERMLRDASLRDTARLLEGFLNNEVPQILGEPELKPDERFHSYQTRKVCTGVGSIQLRRAYYRGNHGGRYPMDEALGLHDQYTPAAVDLMCWAGAMDSSFELASETLARFAGLEIPGRQVQRVVHAFGQKAANWMHDRQSEERQTPVEVLNIQTDMTGIPARPEELQDIQGKQPDGTAKTRQIKVGCVFTQSRDAKGQPQRDPFSSTYFENHADRMKYRTFRRKGYFIGSGAIEGACRHIVAQRAKLSGMRWSCDGAENVMAFRCLIKSNLFDAYCASTRQAA